MTMQVPTIQSPLNVEDWMNPYQTQIYPIEHMSVIRSQESSLRNLSTRIKKTSNERNKVTTFAQVRTENGYSLWDNDWEEVVDVKAPRSNFPYWEFTFPQEDDEQQVAYLSIDKARTVYIKEKMEKKIEPEKIEEQKSQVEDRVEIPLSLPWDRK